MAEVTKAAVSQWERAITSPERDPLLALQRNAGINPNWIMRGIGNWQMSQINEKPPNYHTEAGALSRDEQILVEKYRHLSLEDRTRPQKITDALDAGVEREKTNND